MKHTSFFSLHRSFVMVMTMAGMMAACDNMPGNNSDKWRFYQEIHVSGGTSGQVDAAWTGSSGSYKTHENSYYGGSRQSNYKPYEPYGGYEPGSAKTYYRGSDEE